MASKSQSRQTNVSFVQMFSSRKQWELNLFGNIAITTVKNLFEEKELYVICGSDCTFSDIRCSIENQQISERQVHVFLAPYEVREL